MIDIYATPQDFEAFGRTLMPILSAVGVDLGQPRVEPVTDIVRG